MYGFFSRIRAKKRLKRVVQNLKLMPTLIVIIICKQIQEQLKKLCYFQVGFFSSFFICSHSL